MKKIRTGDTPMEAFVPSLARPQTEPETRGSDVRTAGSASPERTERFVELFYAHYALALNYAFRRVGRRDVAEDVVQSSFLKLLRLCVDEDFEAESFRSWIYRVVTNETNLYFRLERRYMRALRAFFAQRRARNSDEELALDARFESVRLAVSSLPSRYADVLALRYFEQLSTAEVARILKVPESTIRTRVERGLAKLRVKLPPTDDA